jgi:hypothetical protein
MREREKGERARDNRQKEQISDHNKDKSRNIICKT